MRKKRDYVVEGKRIFVGLEDSKRSWKVCVRSGGMVVDEASLPAEYDNLRQYLLERFPQCERRLMYEAGFSGFWLHDRLESDGVDCVVTPAHTVTEAKVNRVKTDRVDARRLAKNLENGDYRECHVPDRELREDRQISRTLDQIQKEIRRTKNRIRKLFDSHGLNDGFRCGSWKKADYEQARSLPLNGCLGVSRETCFRQLDFLEGIRAELLKQMKALSLKERYCGSVEIKRSVPGVGWLSAIRYTLEWGELSRFRSGKHLTSFVGLTSCEHSTGDQVHRGRITGQGSGRVRGWLIQCAWRAIKLDPVLLAKFEAVRNNSGSKKKAIVAVARKMTVRMHALECRQELYSVGVVE